MFGMEASMASSVDLGNQLEGFVSKLVKSGRYNSRSEILREGVRLIHERETRLAALDASIQRGVADADHGRVHDLDEAVSLLAAKYDAAPGQG
jgi:antitoxin ParD1/3/4